jgi:hypothetical protein
LQDEDEEAVVRSPTSLAREEERRKILELEEDRRRAGAGVGVGGPSLSRSSSKITRIIGTIQYVYFIFTHYLSLRTDRLRLTFYSKRVY